MSLVIVDTGVANLSSVKFAFDRLGVSALISDKADIISSAERIILPGVGAAPYAMKAINAKGLTSVLQSLTQPVLGIIMTMPILCIALPRPSLTLLWPHLNMARHTRKLLESPRMIYPAIDLMDGGCVRLLKGDFDQRTDYEISPLEAYVTLHKFSACSKAV